MDRTAGFPADAVDLIHRAKESLDIVAAHVRDVDAAEGSDGLAQCNELVGVGVTTGDIVEAGGQADRSLLHGLAHQAGHAVTLPPAGSARLHAKDLKADIAIGNETGNVDSARAVEGVE